MTREQINRELEKQKGKIPSFVINDLKLSLAEREIKWGEFNQIINTLQSRVKGARLDKKLGDMNEELTRISKGMETLETLAVPKEEGKEEAFPDRIKGIEEKVEDFTKKVETERDKIKQSLTSLSTSLDKVEMDFEGASQSAVEEIEKKVDELLTGVEELSEDMTSLIGGVDLGKIIYEESKS
jgi:archaellum component FlaC